jgi:hypothetical protein
MLTRLVVVINFVNFSFTLFTPPPLGDFLGWDLGVDSRGRSTTTVHRRERRGSGSAVPQRINSTGDATTGRRRPEGEKRHGKTGREEAEEGKT